MSGSATDSPSLRSIPVNIPRPAVCQNSNYHGLNEKSKGALRMNAATKNGKRYECVPLGIVDCARNSRHSGYSPTPTSALALPRGCAIHKMEILRTMHIFILSDGG